MVIYAPAPPPFACAICGHEWVPDRWHTRCDGNLPIQPICRRCESDYGGGRNDRNRDRRIIWQLKALASAIDCEAYRRHHGGAYA